MGFTSDGDVTILPVTYLLDGLGVAFLATWGSKLQVAADGGRMAFEVGLRSREQDGMERPLPGVLDEGGGPAGVEELHAHLPKPWVPSDSPMFWVHLRPDVVSGREIVASG